MAFPSVVNSNSTNGTSASTSAVVNLPAGPIKGNDLLLVFFRCAGNATITYPSGQGWNSVFSNTSDSSDDVTNWAWKRCAGNEGSTVTITLSSSLKYAATSYLIRGDNMAIAPEGPAGGPDVGGSTTPNSLTLTPTGGAKDYLWIAAAAYADESTNPPTFPTNYSSNQASGDSGTAGAGTTNCRVSTATRTNNASSEDPGNFTISISAAWTAWGVAVHPLPATAHPPNPEAFAASPSGLFLPATRSIFLPLG